jgi:hypothetical protein
VGDVLDAMRAAAAGCVDKAMDSRLLPGILSAVAAGSRPTRSVSFAKRSAF